MSKLLDPFRFLLVALAGWMNQRKRYLIHDRDPLFTAEFLRILGDAGVKSVKLPPRSPNLNAHAERNHKGLANRIISPEAAHLGAAGVVQRRQRLGGMLNYYYRAAA